MRDIGEKIFEAPARQIIAEQRSDLAKLDDMSGAELKARAKMWHEYSKVAAQWRRQMLRHRGIILQRYRLTKLPRAKVLKFPNKPPPEAA